MCPSHSTQRGLAPLYPIPLLTGLATEPSEQLRHRDSVSAQPPVSAAGRQLPRRLQHHVMLHLAGKTPRSNKHSFRQPSNLSPTASSSIPSRKAVLIPSPLEGGKRRPGSEGPQGAARSWQRVPRHEPQVAARHSGATGGRAAAPTQGPQEGPLHPRWSHDSVLSLPRQALIRLFSCLNKRCNFCLIPL